MTSGVIHRALAISAAAVLCLALPLAFGESPLASQSAKQPPADSPLPRLPEFDANEVRLGVYIPGGIGRDALERCLRWLALAEPQVILARRQYDIYLERVNLLEVETEGQFVHLSSTAGSSRFPALTAEAVALHQRLADAELDFIARITEFDTRFMAELEAFCAPAQVFAMEVVRLDRTRLRCVGIVEHMIVAEAKIDLVAMSEACGQPMEGPLDEISRAYAKVVTPLMLEAESKFRRARVDLDWLDLEITHAWAQGLPNAAQVRDMAVEKKRAHLHRLAQLQEKIARVNADYMSKIVAVLPPDDGHAFQDKYNRRAYRCVYPDPTGPTELIKSTLGASDNLPPNVTEALAIVCAQGMAEYHVSNDRMKQRTLLWEVELAGSHLYGGKQLWGDDMRVLRIRRWETCEKLARQVVALSAGHMDDRHSAAWRQYLDTITSQLANHDDGWPEST